jgi:hypothetical protein
MTPLSSPDRTEASEYFFRYIDLVPAGDIRKTLESQGIETVATLRGVSEEESLYRYAPGKWSLREMLSHVNDGERLFPFRAFWFARGFDSPLPGFDQDTATPNAGADARSWKSHVDEFEVLRAGTVALFREMPIEAWSRRGIASDSPITVRALAWITAGHVAHHMKILKEKYVQQA